MLKLKLKHNPYDPNQTDELRLKRINLFEEVISKYAEIREQSDSEDSQ